MNHRELAEKVADDLFTNGSGTKASRLVLFVEPSNALARDVGGWCKSAVADRIEAALNSLPDDDTKDIAVRSVLNALGDRAVWIQEEGGPENLYTSLAVSVEKLRADIAGQSPDLAAAKAREIVQYISDATIELAFTRHGLTTTEEEETDYPDVEVAVETFKAFVEEVKADVLACLTGDETGCLDPEDIDYDNELRWVERRLAIAAEIAPREGLNTSPRRVATPPASDGYARAIRDAAKVAGTITRSEIGKAHLQMDSGLYQSGFVDASCVIAAAISALAPESDEQMNRPNVSESEAEGQQ